MHESQESYKDNESDYQDIEPIPKVLDKKDEAEQSRIKNAEETKKLHAKDAAEYRDKTRHRWYIISI